MSDKLTADELFPDKFTADELFPTRNRVEPEATLDGPHYDRIFSEGPFGQLLNRFDVGALARWGADLSPLSKETSDWLKNNGVFKDYEEAKNSTVYDFNAGLLRSAALIPLQWAYSTLTGNMPFERGLITGLTAPGSNLKERLAEAGPAETAGAVLGRVPFGAIREQIGQGGESLRAMMEGQPVSAEEMVNNALLGLTSPVTHLPTTFERMLDDAATLGITKKPEQVAREAFAPAAAPPEMPAEPFVPQVDIHATARTIAPDTFARYDALADHRAELQALTEDVRRQPGTFNIAGRPIPSDATLAEIEQEFRTAPPDTYNIGDEDVPAQARLFDVARMLDRELRATERQLQEMAPQVTEAYREANRLQAAEEIAPPSLPELPPVAEGVIRPVEAAELKTPEIQTLSQRLPSIAQDIARQLRDAGRPTDEARAAAALVAAHFETRADRFGGALGSARDMYSRDAPTILSDVGSGRRGQFNIGKNTITLFRDADASTFIHETGHSWLLEMQRDAAHPLAPQDLRDDWQTVRGWLGASDTLTRAQQEKFARGFERYMMEGQAPSPKLVGVFEKFRQWLARIYQYASRLRVPLNDDIRGVYDRLLAQPNEDPVIAPERPGAMDFADFAEASAREAPAGEEATQADAIRAERDKAGEILSRETDSGRLEARRGPERTDVPTAEGGGGGAAGRREGAAAENAALNTGRNPIEGKSKVENGRFVPDGTPLTDGNGAVRVANLWVPEDIGAAIRQAVGEAEGFATERRTPMTDAARARMADELGLRSEQLLGRHIGEAWNAEHINAALNMLREQETVVRDVMKLADTGDEQGIIDFAIERERYLMMFSQVIGIASEAGRALRALRGVKAGLDQRLLDQILFQSAGKVARDLQLEARMGLTLDTPGKVGHMLVQNSKPGPLKMVLEGWINSILSGPWTHLRNLGGNVGVLGGEFAETASAAALSRLRGDDLIQFAELNDRWEGMKRGAIEGIAAFGRAMRDEGYADTTKMDVRGPAIPDVEIMGVKVPLGQAIRLPTRTLAAEDEFFKAIAYRQQINVLARRFARAEVESGKISEASFDQRLEELRRDPTDDMEALARVHAKYQTFQSDLGPTMAGFSNFVNTHPLAGFFFPFNRTPTNILKYAMERTPAAFAMRTPRDNLLGRNGRIAQNTQIARVALGSMFMAGIAALAYNGSITGGGPYRPEEAAAKRLEGWQPNSFRVGDSLFSYANFDPISIHMQIASDIAEIAHAGISGDKDFEKLVTMAITAFGRDVFQKLSFRGASDIINLITSPEQYDHQFLNKLVASFVPAISAQLAQTEDPLLREIHTLSDAVKARVIGFRETLFPKRNVWGEPILGTDFGPIAISHWNHDPVNAEIDRLGMGMGKAPRKIEGVDLTSQQYDDYVRESGRLSKMLLDKLVNSEFWHRVPDGEKKSMIHNQITTGREIGRAKLKMGSLGTNDDIVAKAAKARLDLMH